MNEHIDGDGYNDDHADGDGTHITTPAPDEARTGYAWHVMFVLGFFVIGLLAFTLWRRIEAVNPVQRCADAYESSYTALDTSLVDRMKVRSPDDHGHTTCSVLRLNGDVDKLPRRELRRKSMP